jgi:CheY-like chemotaxis protein
VKQLSKGRTALVCEDDQSIREMMKTMLVRDGFHVDLACNGIEAMEFIRSTDPDLIVVDLMMPGLNGFEVIERISEEKPRRLKRVLVTTATPLAALGELPAGICTYLPKPFEMEVFLQHARTCSEDTLTRKGRLESAPATA